MKREKLEELISRKLDGELTPSEEAALKAELDSNPQGPPTVKAWRRLHRLISKYAEGLGAPSQGARQRALDAKRRDTQ